MERRFDSKNNQGKNMKRNFETFINIKDTAHNIYRLIDGILRMKSE